MDQISTRLHLGKHVMEMGIMSHLMVKSICVIVVLMLQIILMQVGLSLIQITAITVGGDEEIIDIILLIILMRISNSFRH